MKITKTLIPLTVVALFLSLTLIPATGAEEVNTEDLTLEIGYKDTLKGEYFYKKLVVTEEQLAAFEISWDDWEVFLEETKEDGRMSIPELIKFKTKTIAIIEEIKEMTKDPETDEYYFPDINIFSLIDATLPTGTSKALGGSKLFSLGRGRAWLPGNKLGETFFGMRLLPIFVQHTLGYSKVSGLNILPPAWWTEDRLFVHNLITLGFIGLYINFGERFLDRPAGPVLLCGRSIGLKLGEDIP